MAIFWITAAGAALVAALALVGPGWRGTPVRAAVVAAGFVAAVGAVFWATGGAPTPGAPLDARLAALQADDPRTLSAPARLALLRRIADERPDDPAAFRFLGSELARAGRDFEAAAALRRSAALAPDAAVFVELGEALVRLNDGLVTSEALRAFNAALALEPDDPGAHFYLGLAAFEAGDRDAAAALWGEALIHLSPEDARWPLLAGGAVMRLAAPRAGPDLGGSDAAPPFAGADPEAAVAGMVERLSARLAEGDGPAVDWLTLARVRLMQGDQAGADAALAEGRDRAGEDPRLLALFDAAERLFMAPAG